MNNELNIPAQDLNSEELRDGSIGPGPVESWKPWEPRSMTKADEQLFNDLIQQIALNTNPPEVSFRGMILEFSHVLSLAEALKNNTTLTHLNLSHIGQWSRDGDFYGLHATLIEPIAKALYAHPALKKLDLSNNFEGLNSSRATEHIAGLIENNNQLEEINLTGNKIPDDKERGDGATRLAYALLKNKTLRVLSISQDRNGSHEVIDLCRRVQHHRNIPLISSKSHIDFRIHGKAEALFVTNGSMFDDWVMEIGDSSGRLVNRTFYSPNAFDNIAICNQGFSVELLKKLKEFPNITSITFKHCGPAYWNATDEFIVTVAALTSIKTISFVCIDLSPYAVKALSKALQANSSVKFLHLKDVKLEEEGVSALATMIRSRAATSKIQVKHTHQGYKYYGSPLSDECQLMLNAAMAYDPENTYMRQAQRWFNSMFENEQPITAVTPVAPATPTLSPSRSSPKSEQQVTPASSVTPTISPFRSSNKKADPLQAAVLQEPQQTAEPARASYLSNLLNLLPPVPTTPVNNLLSLLPFAPTTTVDVQSTNRSWASSMYDAARKKFASGVLMQAAPKYDASVPLLDKREKVMQLV